MDGADFLTAPAVNTGDPAADAANEFVVEAVCRSGDLLHGDDFVAVPAYQGHGIIQHNAGDVGDIHHELVHADAA